ncbi:hypothetical protein DEH84_06310 [Aquabacterium olei]|uniref:diguanylate cyclase n=1 Tax=Aquabacterium olei TaxID=1296669 RepID=A0A2U8FQD2_9BURK|nr:GGDEF domain-containing protein [Aquabacterium olei]AWI53087.1 hypothetical protein DEH84_06310 [Aquabacterium olei]
MEASHFLIIYILVTHTLTSGMWWAAGSWMGLSRRASKHWMLSSACFGIGLLLTVLYADSVDTVQWMMAGLLVVVGAVSLRRGMQTFLKLPETACEHALVTLVGVGFALIVALPMGWRGGGMAACTAATAWVLARLALECFRPLRAEFGPETAATHATLMGLVVLTFMTTALALTLPQTPSPWQQLPRDMVYQWLVMGSLTLSILSSFVLGYVVVMRLVRRLEHLSHHDGLTGLLNRRAIEAMLDREVQRLQRFGQPFSLLLIDIDHFKRINDRLGHAAGDAVLAAVAGALKEEAREVDRVARFGGEEFCVVLPHTSEEGALHAAERLRAAVAALDVRWGDEGVSVTISIGLACAEHPTETLSQLLRRADEALYQAKAAGRNRVVLSMLPAAA